MQQYDLIHMQTFKTVVESGQFSKAAEQLNTSTASVSRRITSLETALGTQLFHRTTRKLDLTESGYLFYQDILRIFQFMEEAEERVRDIHHHVSGSMRIAAPMSFGIQKIAPLLPAFMRQYPALQIQLYLEDRYTHLIQEGIDLAIRIGNLTDSSLIATLLGHIPLTFCAAPSYLEKQGQPHKPIELLQHTCLQYSQQGSRENWLELLGEKNHPDTLNSSLIANNAEVLKTAALQGLGITLIPHFMVEEELASGHLQALFTEYTLPKIGLYIVRPTRSFTPLRIRRFMAYLKSSLG